MVQARRRNDNQIQPSKRRRTAQDVRYRHPNRAPHPKASSSSKPARARTTPKYGGAPLNDIFAQIDYDPVQELDKQIELTGHSIKDIKMVIMGHLHLDHAGGLENFFGTGRAHLRARTRAQARLLQRRQQIRPWRLPSLLHVLRPQLEGLLRRLPRDLPWHQPPPCPRAHTRIVHHASESREVRHMALHN